MLKMKELTKNRKVSSINEYLRFPIQLFLFKLQKDFVDDQDIQDEISVYLKTIEKLTKKCESNGILIELYRAEQI